MAGKSGWLRNLRFPPLLLWMLMMFQGCGGPVTLDIAYRPKPSRQSPLASIPSRKFRLGEFTDPGGGTGIIGDRRAAFNQPLGNVLAARPPGVIVKEAVGAVLASHGHAVVQANEDFLMRGQVETFWVRTDVTPTYWDVVGDIRLILEVLDPKESRSILKATYEARRVERTYVWPSEDLLRSVMETALAAALEQMGSDAGLANALRQR